MEAIIETETGGNCKAKGLSGETSCSQYMPATWVHRSTQVLGYVAPLTPINDRYVTAVTVQGWLNRGYSAYQIGLLHNGGEIKEKKGINKFGVAYDSAAYARKVVANYRNLASN